MRRSASSAQEPGDRSACRRCAAARSLRYRRWLWIARRRRASWKRTWRSRVARHAEAQHERLAGGGAAVAFLARHLAHSGIETARGHARRIFRISPRMRGREIAIRQAFLQDCLRHLTVQREAFRLPVLFVPTQTEPVEAVEDGIERGLGVALDIGVVDAQNHRAAVVAGVEPIENEGARAPDVQKARRRGRKADSNHGNASITCGRYSASREGG